MTAFAAIASTTSPIHLRDFAGLVGATGGEGGEGGDGGGGGGGGPGGDGGDGGEGGGGGGGGGGEMLQLPLHGPKRFDAMRIHQWTSYAPPVGPPTTTLL